ncbi:UDP-2,3-diacylglucosamine diphosphatase [bacterium]|nr:UDP-2,3-diacylglucosamine diphosphatase [bacterium]
MIAIYSDLHLDIDDSKAGNQEFFKTLRALPSKGVLEVWLLGDIYDLLVGPFGFWKKTHQQFFSTLAFLSDHKVKVLWVEGNHDFHLKKLMTDLGVEYHQEDLTYEIESKKVYLGHGDTVNQLDQEYLKWRRVIKSPIFRRAISLAPNFVAKNIMLPIARKASRQSRSREKSRNLDLADQAYQDFVHSLIKDSGYDAVFLGHHHKKQLQKIQKGFYLNLGCWSSNTGRYALWTPSKTPEIIELSF